MPTQSETDRPTLPLTAVIRVTCYVLRVRACQLVCTEKLAARWTSTRTAVVECPVVHAQDAGWTVRGMNWGGGIVNDERDESVVYGHIHRVEWSWPAHHEYGVELMGMWRSDCQLEVNSAPRPLLARCIYLYSDPTL
jgi:hypothetical protein